MLRERLCRQRKGLQLQAFLFLPSAPQAALPRLPRLMPAPANFLSRPPSFPVKPRSFLPSL